MKLKLTQEEVEAVLLDCFCNGGLDELYSSGVDYSYNKEKYEQFKVVDGCYEDNLISLLKNGGRLKFIDFEGGGDVYFLTMDSAKEKLSEIENVVIIERVQDILSENGAADAFHGWEILQFILFGEIIFG